MSQRWITHEALRWRRKIYEFHALTDLYNTRYVDIHENRHAVNSVTLCAVDWRVLWAMNEVSKLWEEKRPEDSCMIVHLLSNKCHYFFMFTQKELNDVHFCEWQIQQQVSYSNCISQTEIDWNDQKFVPKPFPMVIPLVKTSAWWSAEVASCFLRKAKAWSSVCKKRRLVSAASKVTAAAITSHKIVFSLCSVKSEQPWPKKDQCSE